jgi:uncharacterized membrane protein (UPF0127 family)
MEEKKTSILKYILFGGLAIFAATITIFAFRNSTAVKITVGNVELEVLVAKSSVEQIKGLSGTDFATYPADGMLFTYDKPRMLTFWMNGMNYDLDVLWIKDGVVQKISRNIPAPEPGETPARIYSEPYEVDMVLELPAGKSAEYNLQVGDTVTN